jgi:3-oxoacyl-[acyl-carrier protein] reductase
VNVLSIAGKNPDAGSGPSAISRAAGLALTKALSREFGSAGILVNAVCVGFVQSGQHEDRWLQRRPDVTLSRYLADIASSRGVPVGRFGDSSEAAAVIAFLQSEEASFVAGAAINVDGGASPST